VTVGAGDLALYAGALVVLFLTPGPVWVALIARALAGGFAAAWPLAVGVTLGDALWPLAAIFGLSWITSVWAGFMAAMKWVAVAIFLVMGWGLIARADRAPGADSRLTRPGRWAGFAAGVAAILGNPKAILFYMGVLPGFFDMSRLARPDIAAIVGLSMAIPLAGNLLFALSVDRGRRLVSAPAALARTNRIAGAALILVGVAIAAG
jgi:threonine/homoserine/homoserine lactone efflux protein